jgi:monoterpene epsilon-lactone hydrolase
VSLKIQMTKFLAGLGNAQKKMEAELFSPPRGGNVIDRDHFTKKVRVKEWSVDEFAGVTINGSYTSQKHILMLPGGAYSLEPSRRYLKLSEYFAISQQMKVTILFCPLSPEYTALEVHQYLLHIYSRLVKEYPEDQFFFLGDFSGGGLALSFLQELRDIKNLPLPVKTAVISPWLDITLDNPMIKIAQKTDHLLPVGALKETGIRYRGPLASDHPFVSPLYGDWEHLGKILVFSGTEDIMTPDCEMLAEKAGSLKGTELIYKKGAGMFHDWILIPCKETDATLDLISAYFLDQGEI